MIDSSHAYVLVHDLLLRIFLRSYYLRIHKFTNKDEYLNSISKSYRRYLFKQQKNFERMLEQKTVQVVKVDKLTPQLNEFVLRQSSLRGNNEFSNVFYTMSLKSILQSKSSDAYQVVDLKTNQIIGFESNYICGHVYYWLTTLIDAEHLLAKSGMYFYFFLKKVDTCFEHGIAYLRMGPTTDATKIKMGGERVKFLWKVDKGG
jgi:hypothetical protein